MLHITSLVLFEDVVCHPLGRGGLTGCFPLYFHVSNTGVLDQSGQRTTVEISSQKNTCSNRQFYIQPSMDGGGGISAPGEGMHQLYTSVK